MNPKTLVMSGGAVRGMAFVGCLSCLKHHGLLAGIDTFVGSSAGALASLLAVIDFDLDAFPAWLCEQAHLTRFNKIDIEGVLELFERSGIDPGDGLWDLARNALRARGLVPEITFLELAKNTGKHLVVCVSNLTLGRAEHLSLETAPDVSVALALRMSMSVPIFYRPVERDGHLYVDGCVYDNLPMGYALNECALNRRSGSVLALYVRDTVDDSFEIKNLSDLVARMMSTVLHRMTIDRVAQDPRAQLVELAIQIPELNDVTSMDFSNMEFPVRESLLLKVMRMGYEQMSRHLKT